jgi:type VI secretion system protein ImpM
VHERGAGAQPLRIGFFGKLPSFGDFVERSLPSEFVDGFDSWLQRSIVGSKAILEASWLDAYLASSIWRFVLKPGVAGSSAWSGIVMPSVDSVGRYFPFAIAAQWDVEASAFEHAVAADHWFAAAEAEALAALDAPAVDLETLLVRLHEFSSAIPLPVVAKSDDAWKGSVNSGDSLENGWLRTLDARASDALGSFSLWWTGRTRDRPSRWLVCKGWPEPAEFAEMLRSGPVNAEATLSAPAIEVESDTLAITATRYEAIKERTLRSSAAVCEPGLVRGENQDAWTAQNKLGCWVVADGMGGHADGARASAMVIEAVNELTGAAMPDGGVVAGVRAALNTANNRLGEAKAIDPVGFDGGTTVVALVLSAQGGCVLWAGDSRAYRWRAGAFDQLTRDHVDLADAHRDSHEIISAVAGLDDFVLEEASVSAEPGDRFLLCSDGVHGVVPEEALATLLGTARDAASACAAIGRAVLAGGAPDNYTALVIIHAG